MDRTNFMQKSKKDVKLLFVNPCLSPGKDSFTKLLPLGLASVMTYFGENGYKFTLLDIDINEYDNEYVENYIKNNHFDIILIGSIVTHYKWMKWFVNMAKAQQPNSKIIVGNSVASSIPDLFLEKTKCDVAVIGEGEITAVETVEAIRLGKNLKDVEGIAFRDLEGNIVKNSPRKVGDINDFSMINWDFFEVEGYINQKIKVSSVTYFDSKDEKVVRSMPIISARGCAFRCTFCHFVFWDDPYRNRSPKSILA